MSQKSAYLIQKRKAFSRGIDFELTFEEWAQWWSEQGVDKNQSNGNTAETLCMCRKGDTGPYSLDNIYCATRRQNSIDSKINKPAAGRTSGFARRVQTPDGIFASRDIAARHYGVTGECIGWRIVNWDNWNYIDSNQNGKQIKTPLGIFSSQRQAALAQRVPVSTIQRYRKTKPQEYYYV